MKSLMWVAVILMLSGCSLDPEYQKAVNNYAKDNCKGKLLEVSTKTGDGTLDSRMAYWCIEDSGVKTYWVTVKEIPQKYREIE